MESFHADTEVRLRRAQGGDAQELDLLMREHLPFVRRIAALNLGRRLTEFAEVEDVVQESMIHALEGLGRFSYTTRGSFRRWLARVVENEVRNLARHHAAAKRGGGRIRRLPELESRILTDSVFGGREPTPSQAVVVIEMEALIEAALLELDDRERRAIVLRQLGEADYATIAEELGFSAESSARSFVHRTLAKLSAKL